MASVRKEISIDAPADRIWDALRDVGALHTRLVPGFVTDTRIDGNARIVTFGNGMVAREEIVSVDDAGRRSAWAVLHEPFRYYSAAARVEPYGRGSRFIWTADFLPNELSGQVESMMDTGINIIKDTLENQGSANTT